jgi:glucokinase
MIYCASMRPVVAVDLGGTNIRAAFYPTGDPPAVAVEKRKTPAAAGPGAVLDEINAAIASLPIRPEQRQALVIGVGAPGPLDNESGVILRFPNLPGWRNLSLRDALADRWACPVRVENDANLAALGEWRYGAGRGAHHLVMLTIGTGIGGGVIIGDRLLTGSRGLAGELGHIPVQQDGPRCSCGQSGHLESIASATAIARQIQEKGGLRSGGKDNADPSVEAIADAARAGNAVAVEVMQRAAHAIGIALSGLVHIFNPERIIIGGGVARTGDWFLQEVDTTLRKHLMDPSFGEHLELLPTALDDEAGLLGSLALLQTSP